ncbi:guanylate kinase [Embleya sp. NPDC056575]|uniref:guanylate kinase n=1 Tax=unclassified Embleya TaxID=2699296 RepID=UPI003690D822
MTQGVILYGPPASGKDTVTSALAALDSRYAQFRRLKFGSGRTEGYRMGTAAQLAKLRTEGGVVYENSRYDNVYVVDRPGLVDACARGVPVVHLGQIEGILALVGSGVADWTTVLLWCPREITESRSKQRGDSDTDARLVAWDATLEDLEARKDMAWHLTVPTATTKPAETARLIDEVLTTRRGKTTPV